MSRLNVNSVNPHDGVKVSITGSTNGGLVISGSPQHDGHPVLRVEGSISASGEITASNALFTGNVRVIGESTISASAAGGIFLGDANTDYVVFGADVSSSIIPDLDDRLDLGTSTQEWKDIYIDGVGYIDAIDQDDVAVTNNLKGDWHWKDDSSAVSLFVHSADGNVGVKVADPNQEFEVAGRISASAQLSVGGAGTTDGHITGSGNLVISGTLGGEFLHHITASNISASGTLTGEHLYISDDVEIEDDLTVGGVVSGSNLTATHSLGGQLNIADQVSIMDGGGQGRIGIGTLTPDATHRLHILVENSVDQSLLKYQTNAGTATHGLFATGNHYIHSTKTGGALELGAVNGTMMHLSSSGKIITDSTISASLVTATHSFGGEVHIADQVSIMDGGGQGRIGIGTLTPANDHRLHILVANSVDQSLLKYQTNAGTATHGIYATGNHYIHSTKTGGALELGAAGTTFLTISSSGEISSSATLLAAGLNVVGNVTASGNISGSSTSTLSIGGAATFGTSTVVINGTAGQVTASGNISSSGILQGSSFYGAGGLGTISTLGSAVFSNIRSTSHVTASGNISSSGTIIANKFEADTLVSRVGDANTGIQLASDTVDIEANDVIIGKFNNAQIQLNSHVTLSAGTNLSMSAGGVLVTDSIFAGTQVGNATQTLVLDSDDLYHKGAAFRTDAGFSVSNGNITSSGNISSSGGVLIVPDGGHLFGGKRFLTTDGNFEFRDGTVTIGGGILTSNITASAQISASSGFVGDITTIRNVTNAEFHPVFVDSANAELIPETLYTSNSSLTYNPSTNAMTLGQITASGNISASGGFVGDLIGTASFATSLNGGTLTAARLFVGNGSNVATQVGLSGDVTMDNAGAVTLAAAQTNVNSVLATDLVLGEDAQTKINFGTDNEIHYDINNGTGVLKMTGASFHPGTTLEADLGTSALRFGKIIGHHVTASGNVSASGVITPTLSATDANRGITISSNVSMSTALSSSAGSPSFINILSNKRVTEDITNSGGSVSNTLLHHPGSDPSNKVLQIAAGNDSNNVVMTLPAAEAGLSYTFLSSAAPGACTVDIVAPAAILFGVAICDDGNEDISGTTFRFANSKFLRGTRVECISDGLMWSIQAYCLCDVADVATS